MTDALCEAIVGESNDGIFVAQDGELIYANEQLQALTGYSNAELVGSQKTKIVAPGDKDLVDRRHRERMAGESPPSQFEIELETSTGDRVPVELSVSRITHQGDPASVSFCRDISEQKQREQELQELKREYESVFENVQDALFLLDVDDEQTIRFKRFNQREEAFTGKSTDDVRGKTPVEAFGEDLGAKLAANYRTCLQRQETIVYEEELQLDGETTVWQTKLTPIAVDGRIEQIVGSGRDIPSARSTNGNSNEKTTSSSKPRRSRISEPGRRICERVMGGGPNR